MKKFALETLLVIVFIVLAMRVAYTANPADVTSFDRFGGTSFLKVTYEDGPRSGFAEFPVGKNSELTLYNWQNEEGDYKSTELKFIARLLPEVDISFLAKDVNTANAIYHSTAIDYHPYKLLGIGTIIPLEKEKKIQMGCRVNAYNTTLFFSMAEDTYNSFGITYAPEFGQIEVSARRDIQNRVWEEGIRVSKSFNSSVGMFIPEIRIKLTEEKDFYGGGLGFIPKWTN